MLVWTTSLVDCNVQAVNLSILFIGASRKSQIAAGFEGSGSIFRRWPHRQHLVSCRRKFVPTLSVASFGFGTQSNLKK